MPEVNSARTYWKALEARLGMTLEPLLGTAALYRAEDSGWGEEDHTADYTRIS